MQQLEIVSDIDFQSEGYKDAYSRVNAIVIEGEQEAYENYQTLAGLLPETQEQLIGLSKMESRHKKGFQACGKNLKVTPDAAAENRIVTCLLIQSLIIECFAISAYNIYIPVADDFARKITEGVVKEEYMHLNFGEEWLKANFAESKAELEAANRQNLPIVWQMLNQVADDARVLGMEKEALIEDFMISYGEALSNIGFSVMDIMRMSAYGLTAAA
jgi:fatty aldehyde decarbonylase